MTQISRQFKIVVLGKSGVGKTCLSLRFCQEKFYQTQDATVGASLLTKTLKIEGNEIKMQLWDTAGQERYESMTPMYFRSSAAAVVVYDITSKQSFEKAKFWINQFQNFFSEDKTIFLVGNKLDLSDKRKVETSVANEFAQRNGFVFFEASAKTGDNVVPIFEKLANVLVQETQETPKTQKQILQHNIKVAEKEKQKDCC
ncbi:ras-related protein rab-5c [Anaeramoeba ignava]|uniref:Ras-related protein rab-5c n=1 Tax=Anaeramoeba ignava TaxID=1746090 RepID=A0A9Q0LJ81_ANAIG|nr:ras-related protein rab-5c [Anaeramoeba ignava]